MIDFDNKNVFPNNAIDLFEVILQSIDERLVVHKRPLRPSDPNYSVSVYATMWEPDEESFEIGHSAPSEPTLARYQIGMQSLVKDGDVDRGLATSSVITNRIRTVIYRSEPLRVALGALVATEGDHTESMRRWGVRSQRFMSNDIEGTFHTISVIDLWIETENR